MFDLSPWSQSALNWQNTVVAFGETALAANEVVWRRSLRMLTGTLSPEEATRMVLEKPLTLAIAAQSAGQAALIGSDPALVAQAAVTPLRSKVDSNALRLRG